MPGMVSFEVIRGEALGKQFSYGDVDRVFMGRQEDCGIVLPEKTVSRYHCLLDINPPAVRLQDFGSLNGTFLNGVKIGQREREQSCEDAQGQLHEEYELHDGDVIRLGKQCEIKIRIEMPSEQTIFEDETDWILEEPVSEVSRSVEPESVKQESEAPRSAEAENAEQESEAPRSEEPEVSGQADEASKCVKHEKAEIESKMPAEAEIPEAQGMGKENPQQVKSESENSKQENATPDLVERDKVREAIERRNRIVRERIAQEFERREREEQELMERERLEMEQMQKAREQARRERDERERKEQERKEQERLGQESKEQEHKERERKEQEQILAQALIALLGGQRMEQPATPSPVEGFVKVARLGKGGMGEVWKVKNQKTGEFYALKTMLPQIEADKRAQRMFLREAKLSEFLDHRNVVKTYQIGTAAKAFYILMDLCEGGSVEELIQRSGGKLSLNLATYIILQVLSGLDYVHHVDVESEIRKRGLFGGETMAAAKGLVHRDFKPANIFLSDRSDRPIAKVADFGMAKAFELAGLTDMSVDGGVKGTIPFMPRQQAMHCRFSKPEIDVWAAAASYYNMLTGAFPKNFKPGVNVWQVVVMESAVPIRTRSRDIPDSLARVIDRALVELPEIGYKSAAELRRDIIRALPQETRDYCRNLL